MVNKIDNWYEPTDILRGLPHGTLKMSRSDHGFLSGIIKKQMPKKILEVGVAEGCTTSMIIKTLELSQCMSEIISVDLANLYKGNEVGWMVKHLPKPQYVHHTLITGKRLIDCISDIGINIDLVILDTTHTVPGEILEFLTVLPFMSQDGIVVLHDIQLSNYYLNQKNILSSLRPIATKILFSTVSGEKYYNYDVKGSDNIAAFKINEETFKNIEMVFFSLSHPWHSRMSSYTLNKYRTFFLKYYSRECIEFFNLFVMKQQISSEHIPVMNYYFKCFDIIYPCLGLLYRTKLKLRKYYIKMFVK